ncbi:hypothetical protein CCP4SC76_4240005 [Gammaproteobacteria bacterium]
MISGESAFVHGPQTRTASSENARFYDELVTGQRFYAYAGRDPLQYTDPLGLDAEVCHRRILIPIIPGNHCFIRFNGDNNDTSSFDPRGVGSDPAPKGATCEKTRGPQNDDCVRREMKKCKDYDYFGNNCCHCAEEALKACNNQGIPTSHWPNWPINPGPQPGEPGYKP